MIKQTEDEPAHRTRGGTRIFSSRAVLRLYDTIGCYMYLFDRLPAVSGGRFYRFEHIVSYSSGKVVGKVISVKLHAR